MCKHPLSDIFFVYTLPYLDTRIHVIVDVVIFQHTMSVVIEIHTDLKKKNKRVNVVFSQSGESDSSKIKYVKQQKVEEK